MHGSTQPEEVFEGAQPPVHSETGSVGAGSQPKENKESSALKPSGNGASDRRNVEERELESTLQLLVERAQYITGATGTALALPQGEEMVCRASAGTSAPAVGARLQVQSGLTGESILRRQLLRCDNAETDPRVNLEACRALGIASIVVLPLLRQGGEVRGLFELFSDHPYAFEERDLIALERMAVLTQTALDLAERGAIAAKPRDEVEDPLEPSLEETSSSDAPLSDASGGDTSLSYPDSDSDILDIDALEQSVAEPQVTADIADQINLHSSEKAVTGSEASVGPEARTASKPALGSSETLEETQNAGAQTGLAENLVAKLIAIEEASSPKQETSAQGVNPTNASEPVASAENTKSTSESAGAAELSPKELKPPDSASPVVASPPETAAQPSVPATAQSADQATPVSMSRVQKCSACGFPVSEGRTLCLDCENKDLHDRSATKSGAEKLKASDSGANNAGSPGGLTSTPVLAEATSTSTSSRATASDFSSDAHATEASRSAEEFIPAFLANSGPVKESWLSDHVNILAIIVFILCILVAIVIFR